MNDKIYTSIPVNSLAAKVTKQSKSGIEEYTDNEKIRQNLVKKFNLLQQKLHEIKNTKERYTYSGKNEIEFLKKQITVTQEEITKLPKIKLEPRLLERNFMNVAKEILDSTLFYRIFERAKKITENIS